MIIPSSEIMGFPLNEKFQQNDSNLLYFLNKKNHVVSFVFQFMQLYFFSYECPVLC